MLSVDVGRLTIISGKREKLNTQDKRFAVQGMSGVGKTVLVTAIARDKKVLQTFTDGIYWITTGQEPNIKTLQSLLVESLGDEKRVFENEQDGKFRLSELLNKKKCLLILDNVWKVEHAIAFDALGVNCRMLITTQDKSLSTALGIREYELDALNDNQALELLADWTGEHADTLPLEARAVAKECGNIPLALALSAALVQSGIPWQDVLDALKDADLKFFEQPSGSILKSIKISIDALAENEANAYLRLGVYPADTAIPEASILTLWQYTNGLNERYGRKLIIDLKKKALIRTSENPTNRFIKLHDLQYLYMRNVNKLPVELHNDLLKAYQKKCSNGWASGPNDGYFFEHLSYHLIHAEKSNDLISLLFNFQWMQAKLKATNIDQLLEDYNHILNDLELNFIKNSLILSKHVLISSPEELAVQLYSRLFGNKMFHINELRVKARQHSPLILLMDTFEKPMNLRVMTIPTKGTINAIAITHKSNQIISVDCEGSLRFWDLTTGKETQLFYNSSIDDRSKPSDSSKQWQTGSDITVTAITTDDKYFVLGSRNGIVKVLDFVSGDVVCCWSVPNSEVSSLAISTDNHLVVAAFNNNLVYVWNFITSREIALIKISDSSPSLCDYGPQVFVSADGGFVVIASEKEQELSLWDTANGACVRRIQGNGFDIGLLAVTSDMSIAITAHENVSVWNLQTGELVRTYSMRGYKKFNILTLTPDDRWALTGSEYGLFAMWDVNTGDLKFELQNTGYYFNALVISSDSHYAVSASNNYLQIWDLQVEYLDALSSHHPTLVNEIAVDDCNQEAISVSNGLIQLWQFSHIDNGDLNITHTSYKAPVVQLHFLDQSWSTIITPDSKRVVFLFIQGSFIVGYRSTLVVWERSSRKFYLVDNIEHIILGQLFISIDGRFCWSSNKEGVYCWDLDQGKRIEKVFLKSEQLNYHNSKNRNLIVRFDSTILTFAVKGKTLTVYSTDGSILTTYTFDQFLTCINVFSIANRKLILLGDASGYIHILDTLPLQLNK